MLLRFFVLFGIESSIDKIKICISLVSCPVGTGSKTNISQPREPIKSMRLCLKVLTLAQNA